MATQDLAAVVREIQEAWNAKDLDRCASYAHPDARITNMAFNASMSYREYIEGWARAFPDGKIEMTSCIAQGDNVVTEFIGRGTHTGTLKGPTGELPATNRRVEIRCVECYRFRNGKVAEGRMYFDSFSMFQQLGVGAPAQGRSATQEQTARPH
jgi:steroid delta-isomerase-like uncharacterized protein